MSNFKFNLEDALTELGITKNHLSRVSMVRSGTVIDIAAGKTKRLELETVKSLLDTLNEIAEEQGITKIYTLDNIIQYEYSKDGE